jgi:hypothetical protein
MNAVIEQYFDGIEARLLQSPAIVAYQIIRREVALADGKLRLKATLSDGGAVELFEYVSEAEGYIQRLKYSFHWQDARGKLKRRWDNAPHYLHLPSAPHHLHLEDNVVQAVNQTPDIIFVIEEIEKILR